MSDPLLNAPPPPPRRRLIDAAIVCLLALQIGVPLSYYLGERAADERFSWRMFSSVRMQRCRVQVREGRRTPDGRLAYHRVALKPLVHAAWIGMLQRNRPQVVRSFLEMRCAEPEVFEVRYLRRCVAPDGTRLPPDRVTRRCEAP